MIAWIKLLCTYLIVRWSLLTWWKLAWIYLLLWSAGVWFFISIGVETPVWAIVLSLVIISIQASNDLNRIYDKWKEKRETKSGP